MSTEMPATLSEQELFATFIDLRVRSSTSFGPATTHDSYDPAAYLHVYGESGELEDAGDLIFDRITEEDRPEDYLSSLAACMETFATDLRRVMADFHDYKALHVAEPDVGEEPDPKSAAYKDWCDAWDQFDTNPRYRIPAAAEDGAA